MCLQRERERERGWGEGEGEGERERGRGRGKEGGEGRRETEIVTTPHSLCHNNCTILGVSVKHPSPFSADRPSDYDLKQEY